MEPVSGRSRQEEDTPRSRLRLPNAPGGRDSKQAPRQNAPGGAPRRRWVVWVIVAGVVSLAAAGAIRWRRQTPPAVTVPQVAGIPLSSEEVALQRAAEQKPRDPAPWRQLGQLYVDQQQPFEAVWAFQEALQLGPGHVPTQLQMAEALKLAELYRPAIQMLSEVLHRTPGNQESRLQLARLYLRIGEAEPAITTLKGAGKHLATWSDGLLELGRARQLGGDLTGAVANYRRHLDLSPNSPEGSLRLARALLEQGQAKEARRVLQFGRLDAPRDPRFPFYLGLSWIPENGPQKPQEAMDYFKEAFVVAPEHPLPHHYMGLLLARQGRWLQAQVHFLKATEADPTYPDPQLSYARSLEKAGSRAAAKQQWGLYYLLKDDPFQAAEAFREMGKLEPKNVQAPRQAVLAYLSLGRNDWAIREAKAALQRHPNDTELLERLAMLYILNHSRALARRTCQQWLKVEPAATRAHWLLGRAAQDDLQVAEAIKEYEIAVAAEPNNAEFTAALASALNDAGGAENLRRAAELLRTAVRNEPQNASYRHDLGMTLLQLGDLEGARRQFLVALNRNPRHAPSYSGLSHLCARLQKPAMARFFAPLVRSAQDRSRAERELSRRLRQNPTNPEAHYAMARFNIQWVAFSTAQNHLERALELRPRYPEARASLERVQRIISAR